MSHGGKPKALAKDTTALRQIAELQVCDTIGQQVLTLMSGVESVSLARLIESLEDAARLAPRAVGGFEPERLRAEAALAKLRALRRS